MSADSLLLVLEEKTMPARKKSPLSTDIARAIIDHVVDGIISIDEHGTILSFNQAAERIFGYLSTEVIGENVCLLMPEPQRSEHDSYIHNYLTTGEEKIIGKGRRVVAAHKDGSPIYIHLSISRVITNEKSLFVGITRNITSDVLIEEKTEQTNKLLNAISTAQSAFIEDTPTQYVFETLLNNIIDITESEYGFIGQIFYDENAQPYLKTFSLTNIAWDQATKDFYEENCETGLEFRNLDTLFGYTIRTGETHISNNPDNDPHSGGLPHGHPDLNSYLGLPIKHGNQMVGMVGIANRKFGYDASIIDFLDPMLSTCGSIIHGLTQLENQRISQDELYKANQELERRTREISLVRNLDDYLQICRSQEEAFTVTRKIATQLFLYSSGEIYTYSSTNEGLLLMEFWGDQRKIEPIVPNDDCIAARRGNTHITHREESTLYCQHVSSLDQNTICFPIQAQGDSFGIMSISSCNEYAAKPELEKAIELGQTVARQLAMALANLKLRDSLKEQSIKDPLTGLFNRRYIETFGEREIFRAQRSGDPISILMFDIDNFKHFNDTYGHDTGDTVLKMISRKIGQHGRKSDIPCRFGGEEFVLIMPGAPLEAAHKRAKKILQVVNQISINIDGKLLANFSVSCGISCYPQNGESLEDLLYTADQAMYASKNNGRNQITLADDINVKQRNTA